MTEGATGRGGAVQAAKESESAEEETVEEHGEQASTPCAFVVSTPLATGNCAPQ